MTQRQQDEGETTQQVQEGNEECKWASTGSYLSQLREIRGYTRKDVAEMVKQEGIGLSPGHLLKLERGTHEPKSHLVSCILKVVGGDIDDYRELLLDETATKRHGKRMATQRVKQERGEEREQRLKKFIDAVGGEEALQEWLSNPDIVTIQEGMRRYPHLIEQFVALVHVEDKRNQ